jgi:hypothetical protein
MLIMLDLSLLKNDQDSPRIPVCPRYCTNYGSRHYALSLKK